MGNSISIISNYDYKNLDKFTIFFGKTRNTSKKYDNNFIIPVRSPLLDFSFNYL